MTYMPSPFVRRAVRELITDVRPEFVEVAQRDPQARIILDTLVEAMVVAHAVLVVQHAHRQPSEVALRAFVARFLPDGEREAAGRIAEFGEAVAQARVAPPAGFVLPAEFAQVYAADLERKADGQ